MNLKKRCPLALLQVLEKYVSNDNQLYAIKKGEKFLLELRDKDPASNFYFIIQKTSSINNKLTIFIEYKPASKESVNSYAATVTLEGLTHKITYWTALLQLYNKLTDFWGDPVVDFFEEQYSNDFELIDEEAEKPLPPDKIPLLAAYLQYVTEHIEEYKTEDNEESIALIQEEVAALEPLLTTESRRNISKRMAKIWALITKSGTKALQDLVLKFRDKLLTKSVDLMLEQGADIIDTFISSNNV